MYSHHAKLRVCGILEAFGSTYAKDILKIDLLLPVEAWIQMLMFVS